jgi:hypothetical protein
MVSYFLVYTPDVDAGELTEFSSIEFIKKLKPLAGLKGLMLSGYEIDSIECYLTGQRNSDSAFDIGRYLLQDKHGLTYHIYGVRDKDLVEFQARNSGKVNLSAAE